MYLTKALWFVYCVLHNIMTITENFPMLYSCKDYKNITRDKKLLKSRFLVWYSGPISSLLKYKTFFKLENSISQNIRNFLRVGLFFHFSSSESYFLKYKRNIRLESSISGSTTKFRYVSALNIPFLKENKSCVIPGFCIYLFQNMKKFSSIMPGFWIYLSWNIRKLRYARALNIPFSKYKKSSASCKLRKCKKLFENVRSTK